MTDGLSELVRVGLRNPARVVVKVETKSRAMLAQSSTGVTETKERRTPATLSSFSLVCRKGEKMESLIRVLEAERQREGGGSKFIVYMATCAAVDYVYRVGLFHLHPQSSSCLIVVLLGLRFRSSASSLYFPPTTSPLSTVISPLRIAPPLSKLSLPIPLPSSRPRSSSAPTSQLAVSTCLTSTWSSSTTHRSTRRTSVTEQEGRRGPAGRDEPSCSWKRAERRSTSVRFVLQALTQGPSLIKASLYRLSRHPKNPS